MATFKPGDRAKIAFITTPANQIRFNGCEVLITSHLHFYKNWPVYSIEPIGWVWPGLSTDIYVQREYLVPLVDPAAEAFLAAIRRLEREPILEKEGV